MWNLIDYIPWVVVFDFNSLIFFSSLFLAKSSLCAHRYLMQNVWIELKFNTSDFHPLHEFRMVILEKCPPHLTDTERIQFSIMRCSIVLERFFFICECVLIFVCIRFICRQCTRAMHITIQDDAVREKHLNKSKTNNKYKRPFVAKWLNSSGKRSTYYIQKISYRFLQFRFNAWKSASNASKFDTDWLI